MKLTGLSTKSFRVAGLGLAFAVLTGSVWAQEQSAMQESGKTFARYNIFDLGLVGNPPGGPYIIRNDGLISGAAATPGGEMHAVLWFRGQKFDIGTPGLGGPNSAALGVNEFGQTVGQAETSRSNAEDFCGFNAYGFPSSTACRPFLWQDGVMTKLPTLGGDNGFAYMINNRGVVAGIAETDATDPASGCPVNQFEPVIWENGKIHPLPPSHGDSDGVAAQINDKGQVVGASGTCGSFNPNTGLYLVENHAVLWENGTVTDLGNLGGNGGPVGNAGNHACAINNRGQVVGHSELGDSLASPFHGFLWTRKMGKMLDLGTLPGPFGVTPAGQNDFASLALGINDGGEVVGASLDANFDPRAFLWENGVMTDLNTLVAANPSGLYLLEAVSIDSGGEITGVAVANGEAHGFLAIPRAR
jgi:probable HAF family extracellular repeat protein